MPKDVSQALGSGTGLGICMAMAGLAGGVRNAEDILERMGRATRMEIHPHESDYALARRIRGFVDEPSRRGSLAHMALDALEKHAARDGKEDKPWDLHKKDEKHAARDGKDPESSRSVAMAVRWLCSEGAKMDSLSLSPYVEEGALCHLGRALGAASAWSVVDAAVVGFVLEVQFKLL